MSEDVKKNLRTQGKYSDKVQKNRDKRPKESPEDKDPPGKKSNSLKRNSSGRKDKSSSFDDEFEKDSPVKYEENSNYTFGELDDVKIPIEIKSSGSHTLSETYKGVSTILYQTNFIEEEEGDELFDRLVNSTNWNTKNIVIRGEEYPQPRLVAWYGPFPYSYSGVTLEAAEMPDSVLLVKDRIEDFLRAKGINVTLNSVLLNYYRNGHDSVAWHSDDELTMGICPTIASVSLGTIRKFEMKRKVQSYEDEVSDKDVDQFFINLTHGSLLIMNGSMQDDWLHRVPKEYHDKPPRINLTFRTVYWLDKNPSGMPAKGLKYNSAAKRNTSDRSSSSKINFDDNDFPPLSSAVSSFDSERDENPQDVSANSNLSFPIIEDSDKSMECFDNDNSNQTSSDSLLKNPNSQSSPLVNNLNDGSQYFKHDLQSKNIHSYDSFASENDGMNADESSERNQSFDSCSTAQDDSMNVSMDSSDNILQKNVYADNSSYQKKYGSNLNVDAREFVPVQSAVPTQEDIYSNPDVQEFVPVISPVPVQENIYSNLDLENLLQHDTKLMTGDDFFEYAHTLRDKALNHMYEFKIYVQDELSFLRDLMEEGQSERTQRLITDRMCRIVQRAIDMCASEFSGSSYSSRSRGNYSRQEQRESQHTYSHLARGKRYSNREERRTSHEYSYPNKGERRTSHEPYPNRGERHTSQEDSCSNRRDGQYRRGEGDSAREERQYNRGGRHSSRGEGQPSRGDRTTSRGKRSFRQ